MAYDKRGKDDDFTTHTLITYLSIIKYQLHK